MQNNILAIVNEIPLAQWRTEAGLNLRQAMLVNGTLFNSEAWHGVTKKDIILLEKVDESLLRGLLQAHPKIPLEALFLETKSIPIRYILASRRIMYLHNILQRDPNEMVRKIYEAQKTDTSTGDFVELVKEDCEAIELNMSEYDIKKISKDKLKKILKSRVTEAAFKYLISLKQSHSKMENVKYEQFEMSSYLKSPLFKIDDISLLLALKTRTVRGIRNDFGGLYPDKTCPLGCGDLDTLQNILTCSVLQKDDNSTDISTSVINYEDIFCGDMKDMNKVENKNENRKTKRSMKKSKKKINRGFKKKKDSQLCMFSTNAAQLKGKLNSFKSELKRTNAGLFTVQETHYAAKGKVQIENFEIFESIRKKVKGGTMIGAHKALEPFLINEYSDEFELLVVEIKIANREIRVMTGYGPQENWPESERIPFFLALEEEIVKAELAGKSILIELDANSKLGPQLIQEDLHTQSENGKLLAAIIERHGLVIGNSLKQCTGLVTRKRVTKNGTEESIIDFVLMSDDLENEIESIIIDDKREHVLTRISKTKKGVSKVESDHNVILSYLNLSWNRKLKNNRQELFNLKNEDCQKKFKVATTSTNNKNYLSSRRDKPTLERH
jgi:hypothetical protein